MRTFSNLKLSELYSQEDDVTFDKGQFYSSFSFETFFEGFKSRQNITLCM